MSALDRLIDALAECIVARQGLPNRDRAKLVLAEIEAHGWRLVPPKEKEDLREQIALAQQMLGTVTIMLGRLAGVLEQLKEEA
jgi:hypothetical protein